MGREGLVSPQEELRITLPVAWRSVADIEAPFSDGQFAGLSLEHAAVMEGPDPYWDRYCETGDAPQLGLATPGLAQSALSPRRSLPLLSIPAVTLTHSSMTFLPVTRFASRHLPSGASTSSL